MGLPTTLSRPSVSGTSPAYDSARTAMGTATWDGVDPIAISGPVGGVAAGDLIVVCCKAAKADATWDVGFDVMVDGVAVDQVVSGIHQGANGRQFAMFAYLCAGAGTGAVSVTPTWDPELGGPPDSMNACASRFTNISSATANRSASKAGTSGTTYSTDPVSTTVKCVTVGFVSKYSGSTGSWGTDWTNGQGVTNNYSEGYGLNLAAASRQTYKSGGTSTFWGALFAAFPVRTV